MSDIRVDFESVLSRFIRSFLIFMTFYGVFMSFFLNLRNGIKIRHLHTPCSRPHEARRTTNIRVISALDNDDSVCIYM